MKAVILAAGEGRRMRPLTCTRPKVMLPLANKPLLEHLLPEAKTAGIQEFIFVVGYYGHVVRQYFGSGERWGVKIEYVTQTRQLGTAHALGLVQQVVDERFLVINGDVLFKARGIAQVLAKEGMALGVIETQDTEGLGVVEVEGERAVRIHEKMKAPPSNLANAGIYLMTPHVFQALSRIGRSPRGEYELTDCLQLLIDDGHEIVCTELDYWLNLSYPWDLLAANEALLAEMEPQVRGVVETGAVLKGPVSIGEGTLVKAGSYIEGPVIIGRDCQIGPNCYIRPFTAIGDDCHVGNAAEVKNSIVMRGSKIPHHNYVGDSLIGEECNLGAGTKIANLRLDEREIQVDGINTGRKKLGAIIGDKVHTGINACINVGCTIGPETHIGPGALVTGSVAAGSRVL